MQDYFAEGRVIIREGEKGSNFFIISSGEVKVTQMVDGSDHPVQIRVMKQGDFFGEKALLGYVPPPEHPFHSQGHRVPELRKEDVRTATVTALAPGVEVLTLERSDFQRLIGDLKDLRRDYGDEERPK